MRIAIFIFVKFIVPELCIMHEKQVCYSIKSTKILVVKRINKKSVPQMQYALLNQIITGIKPAR